MFPQLHWFTFLFIFLLSCELSFAGWGLNIWGPSPSTTTKEPKAPKEYVHDNQPNLPLNTEDSTTTGLADITFSTSKVTGPQTIPMDSLDETPFTTETARPTTKTTTTNTTTTSSTPEPTTASTTPPTTIPPTAPTTKAPTTKAPTTTVFTSTSTDESLNKIIEDDSSNEKLDLDSKNVTDSNNRPFRGVDNTPDSDSSSSQPGNVSEIDNAGNSTTITPFQGNETSVPNVSFVTNTNKTNVGNENENNDDDDNELPGEGTNNPNSKDVRGIPESDESGPKYTPVLETVNKQPESSTHENTTVDNTTTENVTFNLTTTSTSTISTASPKASIDSVARRVNSNSANSIGSNQLLPILFTLLITQIV